MHAQPKRLTKAAVARALSVGSGTVAGLVRSGALRAAPVGGKRSTIDARDLARFVAERRAVAGGAR